MTSSVGRLASLLTLPLCLWTPSAHGKGKEVTPLYTLDRQKMPHIEAVEYPTRSTLNHVFAVPERNSIGTNSLDNAIGIIDLSGSKARYREVRRNFKKYVSGGSMVFLPPLSPDTIGYSQTRAFLLFNLKTGAYRDPIIGKIFQITIEDIAVLDANRNLFLFNLDYQVAMDRAVTKLKVLDLTSDEPNEIASFSIENEPRWTVLGKTTFFYTKKDERLELHALDDRLRPVEHPLLTVYNTGLFPGEADLPTVHPALPVAIFAAENPSPGGEIVVWAASWRDREPGPKLQKLFAGVSGGFRFSPDGKWVLFRDRTPEPMRYLVMPVDPNLPHFFGPPILLRSKEQVPEKWNGNCAWISDPVSVVCTANRSEYIETTHDWKEIHKLLKWELSAANVRR
jgi:hypothetical protein